MSSASDRHHHDSAPFARGRVQLVQHDARDRTRSLGSGLTREGVQLCPVAPAQNCEEASRNGASAHAHNLAISMLYCSV